MVIVTPASGVSGESLTTVRPRSEVVTGCTLMETVADWITARPLIVADAVTVKELLPGA
jgi:hypothetical protein